MKRTIRMLLLLALACALLCASIPAMAAETEAYPGTLSGILTDGGALIVTDTYNKVVWRLTEEEVTAIAGCADYRDVTGAAIPDYRDGSLENARFMEPWAIVPFLDGWAVSDAAANVVRYVGPENVQTAAGSGEAGLKDGFCLESRLNHPTGLAVDDSGCLYIADTANGAIRKLNTKGDVKTYYQGLKDPTALCWKDGVLYAAETGLNRIVRIENGVMTVVAGVADAEGGFADGSASNALFRSPQGLAVADDGTIYVADTDNGAIRRIRDGRVVTVALSADYPESLVTPRGLALDGETLYCADQLSGKVLALSLAAPEYPDVADSAWYAADALSATDIGLLKGTDVGFEPEKNLTRAMFVTILGRLQQMLDGDLIIDGETQFGDLPDGSWYTEAARWAADAGIVKGIDGSFSGNLDIPRQQLVTMLYRFAEANELDVSARADLSVYPDGSSVASYAQEAMSWAIGAGIISGFTDGTLSPAGTATRAQTAAILIRFIAACGI